LAHHRKFFPLVPEVFSSDLSELPEGVYLLNFRKVALSVQQVAQERAQVAEMQLAFQVPVSAFEHLCV
jgi:hypothetical protein